MESQKISQLIIGGTASEREEYATKTANDSSQFDTLVHNAKESSGIAEIKNFTYQLSRRPFNSRCITAIILESQNLSIEAQNALLKTVEEPPPTVKIIITAPSAESLVSTLQSRCELVPLPTHDYGPSGNHLDKFLVHDFYDRWKDVDKLDLEKWETFWRNILLENLEEDYEKLRRALNYVKLILKAKELQGKRASSKLLKVILLLDPPLFLVKNESNQTA